VRDELVAHRAPHDVNVLCALWISERDLERDELVSHTLAAVRHRLDLVTATDDEQREDNASEGAHEDHSTFSRSGVSK
jgi:hypothetical protein